MIHQAARSGISQNDHIVAVDHFVAELSLQDLPYAVGPEALDLVTSPEA